MNNKIISNNKPLYKTPKARWQKTTLAGAITLAILSQQFIAGAEAATCSTAGDTITLSTAVAATCFLSSTVSPFNNITVDSVGSIIVPYLATADGINTFNTALVYNNTGFPVGNGAITNQGVLAGVVSGIHIRGASASALTAGTTLINSGTINAYSTAATVTQGTIISAVTGVSVDFASGAIITNTGSILNYDTTNARIGLGTGLSLNSSSGSIINNGSATANSGTISGGTGIALLGTSNTTINNNAGGSIVNGINIGSVLGVADSSNSVIHNKGSITHVAGTAIYQLFGSGTQIINDGSITGSNGSIYFFGVSNGKIQNNSGGTISGGIILGPTTTPTQLSTNNLIDNRGTIIVGDNLAGVYIASGANNITNSGSISAGTRGVGVFFIGTAGSSLINSGAISGGSGVILNANSNFNNALGGTIQANDTGAHGLILNGLTAGTYLNSGTITALAGGSAVMSSSQNIILQNNGKLVSANGTGLGLQAGSTANTINNNGAINAFFGINVQAGSHSINNLSGGTISAGIGIDIAANSNGNQISNAGVITIANNGVGVRSISTANTNINNSGTIQAGSAAYGVYLYNNTAGSVINSGTINSGLNGIGAALGSGIQIENTRSGIISTNDDISAAIGLIGVNGATVSNAGKIIATHTSSAGIYSSSSNVTITSSGSIEVGDNGAGIYLDTNAAANTLNNSGSITSLYSAIQSNDGSHTINNLSEGKLIANFGVLINADSSANTIDNKGAIAATTDGIGVQLNSADNSLSNSGAISAAGAGIGVDIGAAATGTVLNNTGTITSGFRGLRVSANNTLVNEGRISATNEWGVAVELAGLSAGSFSNNGSINAADKGVGVLSGANNITVSNSKDITAAGQGVAVDISNGSNSFIENSGTISSGFASIRIADSQAVSINNGGTLSGRVLNSAKASQTSINNSGMISGSNNSAILYTQGLDGTLSNSGTITLNNSDSANFSAAVLALGVNSGSFSNHSTISIQDNSNGSSSTATAGVYFDTLSGDFTNSGSITNSTKSSGREAYGVLINTLNSSAVFNNSGTITVNSGSTDAIRNSVAISYFEGGAGLNNTGTIDKLYIGAGTASRQFKLSGYGDINTLIVKASLDAETQLQISGNYKLPNLIAATIAPSGNLGDNLGALVSSAADTIIDLDSRHHTILGRLNLGANNRIDVDLNPNGDSGRIIISGAVTTPGTTKININQLGSSYIDGQVFTIIDGAAGSSLSFDSNISDNSLLYNFEPISNGQDLLIRVVGHGAAAPMLQSWSDTGRQQQDPLLYHAIQSAESSGATTLSSLLEQLSPDNSASVFDSYRENSLAAAATINKRLNTVRLSQLGLSRETGMAAGDPQHYSPSVWLQAYSSNIKQSQRQNTTGYNADSSGFALGIDSLINDATRLGIGFNRSNHQSHSSNGHYSSDSDSTQAFIYGSYLSADDRFIDSSISYGKSDYQSRRQINLINLSRTAHAQFDAKQLSAQLFYGKHIRYNNELLVSPYIGSQYSRLAIDSYQESGAQGANLRIAKSNQESLEAVLGTAIQKTFQTGSGHQIVPELHASWRRELIDNAIEASSQFIGGGVSFKIQAPDTSDNTFTIGASISLYRQDGIDIKANYDYASRSGYSNHSGFINVKINTDFNSPFKKTRLKSVLNTPIDNFDAISLNMAELSPVYLADADTGLGIIAAVDDFRYSNINLNGFQVDAGRLNYGVADSFRSVATYVGNTPMLSNTSVADFDHINYFERYDAKAVNLSDMPSSAQFGHSGLAAVLQYIPNKPVLGLYSSQLGVSGSRLQGSQSGELGNGIDGVWNLPLGNSVALRIAGGRIKTEGITDYVNLYQLNAAGEPINASVSPSFVPQQDLNRQGDVNSFFTNYGRASLLWRASTELDLQLTAYHQKDDRGGNRIAAVGRNGYGNAYQTNQSGALIVEPKTRETNIVALDLDYQADNFHISSNTSRYQHQGSLIDDVTGAASNLSFLNSGADYCENTSGTAFVGEFCAASPFALNSSRPLTVLDRRFNDQGISQEIKISSSSNNDLQYSAGLFYHQQKRTKISAIDKVGFTTFYQNNRPSNSDDIAINSDLWSIQAEQLDATDLSLYSNISYLINQQWKLIAGLKGFSHKAKETALRSYPMFEQNGSARFAQLSQTLRTNEQGFLPNFTIEYQARDNIGVYLKLGQGYRPGGLNSNALVENSHSILAGKGQSPLLSYEAETLSTAILGVQGNVSFSSDLNRNPLRYELSLFSRFARDKQINTFNNSRDTRDQLQQQIINNAGSAIQQGLELKLASKFSPRWSYSLNYNYNYKAEIKKALYQTGSISRLGSTQINNQGQLSPTGLGQTPTLIANSGTRLAFSPEHTAVVKTDYLIPYKTLSLRFFASLDYRSDMHAGLGGGAIIKGSSTMNIGASVLWEDMDISLWANNIGNSQRLNSINLDNAGPLTEQSYYGSGNYSAIALPRNIGMTVNYKF